MSTYVRSHHMPAIVDKRHVPTNVGCEQMKATMRRAVYWYACAWIWYSSEYRPPRAISSI